MPWIKLCKNIFYEYWNKIQLSFPVNTIFILKVCIQGCNVPLTNAHAFLISFLFKTIAHCTQSILLFG